MIRLSKSESRIAKTIAAVKLPPDVFPIVDPDLAKLSELLHKMTVCKEDAPATQMAGEAIRVPRGYVVRIGTRSEGN